MKNKTAVIGIGLIAGLIQALAGVAMYLAGVYFAPWSMFVSFFVHLMCIVAGTILYRAKYMNGKMTYAQALVFGVVISLLMGLVYAVYNIVSISFFYPNFLDEMVRAWMAQAAARGGEDRII